MGREDIPVAVGSAESLEGDHSFPGSWRSGADRPYGSSIPQATAELVAESTAELLAKVVNAYPGQVTVVLLGAHTDLALALRHDPVLASRIKDIVMMGGAVYVPGNIHAEYSVIANETAEWNLWLDYRAAAEVFASGIPLSVVPLDATNQVTVDRQYYDGFAARAESPAAQAVAQFWESSLGWQSQFYIWDVVAVAAMTRPELVTWESLAIEIVTDRADDLGQTQVLADQPPNAAVCVAVDVSRLRDDLISVLNR
jgi:inosine-uridine nucleoside N-ribohydrolase